MMYEFPVAAVTNHHRCGRSEQQTFIIEPIWRSEVQKGSHWATIEMSIGREVGGAGGGILPRLLCSTGRRCAPLWH